MRVLVATPHYPPEGGGLENYAREVSRRLAARGHEVRVLTNTRRPAAAGTTEDGGVTVMRRPARLAVSNTPIRPRLPVDAARLARDADVVWAHTPVPYTAEAATVGARLAGAPWCVTYHAGALEGGSRFTDAAAWLNRRTLERHLLSGAAGLAAVSPFVRDHALRPWRGKTVVAPPGVDVHRFTPGAHRAPGHRVLYVGPVDTAYRWKGFHVLFDAYLRARRQHPNLRLDVVGEGDQVEHYRRLARDNRAGEAVTFHGRLPHEKLVAAYQRADVTVLPSVSDAESFGMVLAEAQACGCAAIATTAGGARFAIQEGETGRVVPAGDAAALCDALAGLFDDPESLAAMQAAGPGAVAKRFPWRRATDATEALLRDAVTSAGQASRA